ncbi:hypothetical protein LINGRAHAP2_LOCUS16983, partial [Linum grandiflorum]
LTTQNLHFQIKLPNHPLYGFLFLDFSRRSGSWSFSTMENANSKLDAAIENGLPRRLRELRGQTVVHLGLRPVPEISRLLDLVGPDGEVIVIGKDETLKSPLEELAGNNANMTFLFEDPEKPAYNLTLFDFIICDLDHHDKVEIVLDNACLGLLPGRRVCIFTDKLESGEEADMAKYFERYELVKFTFSGKQHYCHSGVFQPIDMEALKYK